MSEVLKWIVDKDYQLMKEANYTYEETVSICRTNESMTVTNVTDWARVGPRQFVSADLTDIFDALQGRPLSIGLSGKSPYFMNYKSGILTNAPFCMYTMNHAVTAVGWGKDATAGNYMIIKNSWGTGWGEQGFARVGLDDNVC